MLRYARLLEGLECEIVCFSSMERTGRIDTEYFQKRHLQADQFFKRLQFTNAAACATVSDGNHFSISESFTECGIPYYRGQDVVMPEKAMLSPQPYAPTAASPDS